MSYCVHCGVELDDSAKKCALCDTPVIDPNTSEKMIDEKPFSDDIKIPPSIKKRFIAYIVTMIMLIPNIVLVLVNAFFYRNQVWSVYILATTVLVWVLAVFPFFAKRFRPYLMWAFDTLAVGAYSYVFIVMQSESSGTFFSVFSVLALFSIACFIMITWLRRQKRHWTAIMVHIFVDSGLISIISGSLIRCFTAKTTFFYAGLICSLCFFALTGFFIYCNRSNHVRAWLNKAFNI